MFLIITVSISNGNYLIKHFYCFCPLYQTDYSENLFQQVSMNSAPVYIVFIILALFSHPIWQ